MSIRNNKLRLFVSLLDAPKMEFASSEKEAEFEEIRQFSDIPPANLVVRLADDWARLMEKEMLRGDLDENAIRRCQLLAECTARSERNSAFWAKGLLEDFWKYGSLLRGYSLAE